jgi:hypothetical protein
MRMNAPSAPRPVLVLLAGILWSVVGTVLMAVAVGWLSPITREALPWLVLGLGAGVIIHRWGFSKLAEINLVRIFAQAPGKDRVCVFAFQNTRSYVIIVVMIALGYTLRHLPIPRVYLAPIYLGIGLGLFLSSLKYYARLVR